MKHDKQLSVNKTGTSLSLAAEAEDHLGNVLSQLTKINNIPMRHNLHLTGGHGAPIMSVLSIPGEKRFLTASNDNTIRLWDEETGQSLMVFIGHTGTVRHLAWRTGRRQFVSVGWDYKVILWDVDSGKLLHQFDGHRARINQVAVFPDGKRMVTVAEDKTVKLWHIDSGSCLKTGQDHQGQVRTVIVSNSGQRIYTGASDGTLIEWDNQLQFLRMMPNPGQGICCLLLNHGQDKLIVAQEKGRLAIFDVISGDIQYEWQSGNDAIKRILFSHDEKQLLVGDDYGIMKWIDLKSRMTEFTYNGPTYTVDQMVWPDNDRLYFTSKTQAVLVDLKTGNAIRDYRTSNTVENCLMECLDISHDGTVVATGDRNGRVGLFESQSGKLIKLFTIYDRRSPLGVKQVRFSEDGKKLYVAQDKHRVLLFDVEKQEHLCDWEAHEAEIRGLAITKDGNTIITAGRGMNKNIKLWDKNGTFIQYLEGHENTVFTVEVSNEQVMASGSGDGSIRLWDIKTWQCKQVIEVFSDWIIIIKFSPDGKYMAAYTDKGLVLLYHRDAKGNYSLLRTFKGISEATSRLVFSPDSKRLAIGTTKEGIRIWHIEKEVFEKQLVGHWNSFYDVSFNSDRTRLLATSCNGILSWDLDQALTPRAYGSDLGQITSLLVEDESAILVVATRNENLKKINVQTGNLDMKISQSLVEVSDMFFRKETNQLFTANSSGFITGHDGDTGMANCWFTESSNVECMVFASQKQQLFAGCTYGGVKHWNLINSDPIHSDIRLRSNVTALALDKAEEWLYVCGINGQIGMHQLGRRGLQHALELSHYWITTCALMEDDEHLVIGTSEGYLTVTHPFKEKELYSTKFESGISKIKRMAQGNRFIVGFDNGVLQCVDEKGKILTRYEGHQVGLPITAIEFYEEKKLMITGNRDGTICFWSLDDNTLLGTYYNMRKGYLWTTPADNHAPHGWFWTEDRSLINIVECDEDGKHPKSSENSEESNLYFNMYHQKEKVLQRIFNYPVYKQTMRDRSIDRVLGNKPNKLLGPKNDQKEVQS